MTILHQVYLCVIYAFLFLTQSVDNRRGYLFRALDTLEDNELVNRIVGGMSIPITEAPYQVSVQKDGVHFCGGALITKQHVVTAAHCIYDTTSRKNLDANELSIRVGSTFRDHGGLICCVQSVISHPYFDSDIVDYDIAVLKLKNPVPVNEYIEPIPLASRFDSWPPGTPALISGWGAEKEGLTDTIPEQLNAVLTQIIDHEECRATYETITDRMICAGEIAGGKDACQGDSGGPLVIDGVLAGVVSFGSGCARPGIPGVYSSIPVLRGFIVRAVRCSLK